ncbi:hypothetical protein M378DRAFT_171995 [Amanita muscaria Koide BX008]|uniref:WD40 repeat-like protein n=1 Tax=Amanita muscaria (strain Koide BX008) TaxID=946122 RepID=A0A0C2W7R6_AMAMK|nr:hypothetical protein M378DRAFT_171995 [Amanita muscaria Koide BX008]
MSTNSSSIQELALSSESSRVAAALSDGTVWLWDNRNELIDSFDGFKGSGKWYQLQFSPTGTRLAYSSANGIIQLRDGINGRFIADMQCGSRQDLEFSGDGSRIASLSRACGLTLWNSESGALIGAVTDIGDIRLDLGALAISANGSLLATANRDKVTLWSGNDDSLAQIKVLNNLDLPGSMTFSLDNILAIATEFDIKLYNVKTHSFISTLPFGGDPAALAFSPDYTHVAVGTYDGGVYLWDIRAIDASGPPANEEVTAVCALALSRDCSRLACGFENGTVELWDTSPTKRPISSHQVHETWAEALGFGPDGGLFASGSDDGTVKLWNGEDGSLRGTLTAPSGLRAVALSNTVLVAVGDGDVTLWSLDTQSLIHTFKQPGDIVSIAENSTLIVVAVVGEDDSEDSEDSDESEEDGGDSKDDVLGQSSVSLLDVVNHTTIATFNVPQDLDTMSFLPDNSQIVAQTRGGVFLSLNLINKDVIEAPTLEHLIQLPDTPLWNGVPIWHCRDKEQHYFSALFPQHQSPVPVLWIPRDLPVTAWTQGSSMIALGCGDGRVMLLRIPISHVG